MTTEKSAVRGALLGVAVFFPSIVGATLLAGGELIGALGLAAYGSFFGGMGFGAMLGAVIHLVRIEEARGFALEHGVCIPLDRAPGPDDPEVAIDAAA